MEKSAVIAIETLVPHPTYTKRTKSTNKITVHDETNSANIGDFVEILPIVPKSKNKRFALGDVIRKAN
jgi:small subunit ribosomal protein S17